jgi:hypothetical protein
MPPFDNGDPTTDNKYYTPNTEMLGFLNVGFVITEFELNSPGLALEAQFGDTRIYGNTQQMPRAWIQALDDKGEMKIKSVKVLNWEANRIRILAEGPGTLILSEIDYPGWKVWVDGEVSRIYAFEDILRSVPLLPGEHEIAFVFQPTSLYVGMLLCLPTIIYLARNSILIRRLE